MRLSRPLDWLVVADHSDGMGMVGDLAAGKPQILAFEQGARWSKGLEEGGDASVQAALDLISNFSQGTVDPALMALYSPGSKLYKNLWEKSSTTPRHSTTLGGLLHALALNGLH